MTSDQQIHEVDQPTYFCDALTFDRRLNDNQKNTFTIADADPRLNMAGAILVAFAIAIAVGFMLLFSGSDHTSSKAGPAPFEKMHFARATNDAPEQRDAPAPKPEISSKPAQPG